MTFRSFKKTARFRKSFSKLTDEQKRKAKQKFAIFKKDPFAPSLNTHPIKRLSAEIGQLVYSVTITADLRSIFVIDDDTILSLDIGTHEIYKAKG